MSTLLFLAACKVKNKFIELLHKPFRLFVVLAFALLLAMNFTLSQGAPSGQRPLSEFGAIIFAFYILCFVTESRKGFHSGGTMFSMADANLLFMSPLKAVKVLFYGMLSRLGTSLYMGLAFVYQFTLLRSFYPITAGNMLTAVAGYGAVVFLSQLAGMLIYFYTCGNAKKIKRAKVLLYSLCGAFGLLFLSGLFASSVINLSSAAAALTALPLKFFPVAGWVFTAVDGIMTSAVSEIVVGVIACLVFSVTAFILLAFSKQGYYEDVLLSAERGADSKADEGASAEVKTRRLNGRLRGQGASVLLYKHILENRRTKMSLFSPSSLVYLILICVYGYAFNGDFAVLFSFSCMVSFVPVLSGRWLKELTMPHIFLIPEPPVRKLFYILPEMLPRLITESVLQCALIGYICYLTVPVMLSVTVSRLFVSFVLIGSALLAARIFREREKNSIFLSLSVLPGLLFILPSVLVCVTALNYGFGIHIAFGLMSAVNAVVSSVLLFFSRNILKITD